MLKAKVLIVDDEPDALELVEFNLKRAGFEVLTATEGNQALAIVRERMPNVVVLDVMLPGIDGLELCKLIRNDRRTAAIPVIMLTAKAAEIDRVLGLELGADDYLTKPFSPRELVLRIKNVLGRRAAPADARERIQIGAIAIDRSRHEVTVQGKPVELTATEFKLLTVLAERRGRVQTRDHLLRDVWEYDTMIDTRTVDTHVRRLREKLGRAADRLETVRGVGYRFTDT